MTRSFPSQGGSHLPIAVLLVVDHLGRPVGEPLLLRVNDLVERPARLRKPMFVSSGVGVPGTTKQL